MTRRIACALFACLPLWLGCGTRAATPATPDVPPLERKLADNPNDPQVNLRLGEEAEATGDLLRAEQYYRRAEALGVPEDQMVPRIVRVLVQAHRYREALARCRLRLQRKPGDRATRYVEAALLVALDQPHEAERELDALMRTDPRDPGAYLALGRLYRDQLGDADRARGMFEQYLKLAPDGEAAAAIRFQLAEPAPAPAPTAPEAP